MPNLDVSEVLTDPDFFDVLQCTRNIQTVGNDGVATLVPSTFSFVGVVTQDSGRQLQRMDSAERVTDRVTVITRTRLRASTSTNTADIVTWDARTWTVTDVSSYSRYGQGFVEASCELVPLA